MAKLPPEVLGDGPSLPLPGCGVRLFLGLWPLSYNLCLCLHLAASPRVCCVSLFLEGYCCRKGDPFRGPRVDSYLALRNELSEETPDDKARDFIHRSQSWVLW